SVLRGISLVNDSPSPLHADDFRNGILTPAAVDRIASSARSAHADGALIVAVTRFGLQAGIERRVWLQTKTFLVRSDGDTVLGPFYSLGSDETLPKLIGKGYARSDEEMLAMATGQAARRL